MKPKGGVLDCIERLGNRLPDPTLLFVWCVAIVMVLSEGAVRQGWAVQPVRPRALLAQVIGPDGQLAVGADGNPVMAPVRDASGRPKLTLVPEGEEIRAQSLLRSEGLYFVVRDMVKNFINFPPLGVVLVGVLGVGVAELTGLIGAMLRAGMLVVPKRLLTPMMVFIGVSSSLAADAGYIVLPPLAAALYKSVGRSPLAGVAAVFAGLGGGFSANLLITSLDPLLSGLTQMGARVIDPSVQVNPACNWWFMIASTVFLTLVGWAVSAWVVEKRLSRRPAAEGGPSPVSDAEAAAQGLSAKEWRALTVAMAVAAGGLALVAACVVIPGWPLHTPVMAGGGSPERARWVEAIVPILFFLFFVPGVVYGRLAGTLRTASEATGLMSRAVASMAPVLVMSFVAAQLIAHLKYSRLDAMLAYSVGTRLAQADMNPLVLIAAFVGATMLFNLLMASASAKWSILAPVFVPMFMLLGFSPALTQAAYRVGDSVTNLVTPLNAYLVLILAVMQKYATGAKMGTLLSMMIPFSLTFGVLWLALLLCWYAMGIPLGPGGGLHYVPGQ